MTMGIATRHALRGLILLGAIAVAPASARAQDATDSLVAAYQKEFAFLEAEKRALETRLEQLERQGADQIGRAQAELARLQARLIAARGDADDAERQLRADEGTLGTSDLPERVGETLDRGRVSLAKQGHAIAPTPADEPGRLLLLAALFETAVEALDDGGRLRSERAPFFLPSGKRVDGTILHVGRIAAYGVSGGAAGALAPAGDGRLRLWPADAAHAARTLAAGGKPAVLPVVLFDTGDRPVEPARGKTPLEIVRAGGLIAWIIVVLGVLATLLVAARALLLWRASGGSGGARLVTALEPLVGARDWQAAIARSRAARGTLARVIERTVAGLRDRPENVEDQISEAMLDELPRLERFSAAILTVAAVAPLLGLLGTVTGMISTFDVITVHGTGNPKLLSGGISEALITTELGLMVAIPMLLCGTRRGRERGRGAGRHGGRGAVRFTAFKRRASGAGIDVSPLIDMVFILLIFFMVTTTFVKDLKIDLERPKASSAERASSKAIRVHLDRAGQVYVDGAPVKVWMLQSRVRDLLADGRDSPVLVVTDRQVAAERLIEVVDQCRLAGAEDVGVATDLETS